MAFKKRNSTSDLENICNISSLDCFRSTKNFYLDIDCIWSTFLVDWGKKFTKIFFTYAKFIANSSHSNFLNCLASNSYPFFKLFFINSSIWSCIIYIGIYRNSISTWWWIYFNNFSFTKIDEYNRLWKWQCFTQFKHLITNYFIPFWMFNCNNLFNVIF